MNTYSFTRKQLNNLLTGTVEMFLEYQNVHKHSEASAKFAAVAEMFDGLDADKELVEMGEGSVNIQIHDEPVLTEDEIFRAALLNPTPDTCPECGCDDVGLWVCYACGYQFEQSDNISPTSLGLEPAA